MDLNVQLDNKLRDAGFTTSRIQFHLHWVDYIEAKLLKKGINVIGSFGEGWGYNLSSVNGLTSHGIGIDVLNSKSIENHFRGCRCPRASSTAAKNISSTGEEKYRIPRFHPEDHLPVSYAVTCNQPERFEIHALVCSCVPQRCTVFTESSLPASLVERCKDAQICLVAGFRPGQDMVNFRICYSLMERNLVRSFPEIIGRSLVLLKYLFKTKLKGCGLTSYIAKTLLLYYMSRNSELSNSIIVIAENVLNILSDYLKKYQVDNQNTCIPHFFHTCPIYFSCRRSLEKNEVVRLIMKLLSNGLHQAVTEFIAQLQPVSKFYFSQYVCQFREFLVDWPCDPVNHILMNFDWPIGLEQAKKLPATCSTVKLVLELLYHLQSEAGLETAVEILNRNKSHAVNFLTVKEDIIPETRNSYFSTYLEQPNTSWMYAIHKERMSYFPEIFLDFSSDDFYGSMISFKAVLNCLRRDLTGSVFSEDEWSRQIRSANLPDFQEIYIFAMFAEKFPNVVLALDRLALLECSQDEGKALMKLYSKVIAMLLSVADTLKQGSVPLHKLKEDATAIKMLSFLLYNSLRSAVDAEHDIAEMYELAQRLELSIKQNSERGMKTAVQVLIPVTVSVISMASSEYLTLLSRSRASTNKLEVSLDDTEVYEDEEPSNWLCFCRCCKDDE